MTNLTAAAVIDELQKFAKPEKAEFFPKFFKSGKGEYGEGDVFIGVTVPDQRKVAKQFIGISLNEVGKLLQSEVHEHRLTAIILLVTTYEKAKTQPEKKQIFHFYLAHTQWINNWDIVDASARQIVGAYLHQYHGDRKLLVKLTESRSLWEQRIAVIATYYFIKKGEFSDTLKIAAAFLNHPHDLIHKAVGWMLREVGNVDKTAEVAFLDKYYLQMPRTMLRYAIEKFPPQERAKYMAKN